jgi:hypothetical protein
MTRLLHPPAQTTPHSRVLRMPRADLTLLSAELQLAAHSNLTRDTAQQDTPANTGCLSSPPAQTGP